MDTWRFYMESLPEYRLLLEQPAKFFRDLFIDPYDGGLEKIFSTTNSYWNDLKNNFMIKLMAIFNLFSFRHYYTNLVFFSFLGFFGPAALYRVFLTSFPRQRTGVMIGCFLIPSVVFWCSGFHKEGLLFTALGLYSFFASQLWQGQRRISCLVWMTCSLFLIFILRNNILFALLPATTGWMWSSLKKWRPGVQYLLVNLFFMTLFFTSKYLYARIDLPLSVSLRQAEFIRLGGNTAVPVEPLEPSLAGFIHNLPSALDLAFLRPYPGQGGLFYIPFTMEVVLGVLLVICLIFFPRQLPGDKNLRYFALNFAVLLMLIIGYTVPNVGAVVRYRSLALPFLFIAMILMVDCKPLQLKWKKSHIN